MKNRSQHQPRPCCQVLPPPSQTCEGVMTKASSPGTSALLVLRSKLRLHLSASSFFYFFFFFFWHSFLPDEEAVKMQQTAPFTLEKEMATHSSVLAWEILWTEEPGRLQSMGLQRVGHAWAQHSPIPPASKRPVMCHL